MENKTILNYRPDIDGLRAVAVLFVIVFHAFPKLLAGGFIGVDIFFVISGFLISGIIFKALKESKFSYLDFYNRRIKRIFPALVLVLLSCLIAGWLLLFSSEYLSLGKNVASGAGFVANITYWLESGYFDISSTLKPLIHLWSLGVEEQFYIFWPILLVFIYRKIKKVPQIISILLFLSFLLSIYVGFRSPEAAFYLPFTRFWELMSGAFLAHFASSSGGLIKSMANKLGMEVSSMQFSFVSNISAWFGLVLLVMSVVVINSVNFYSGIVVFTIIATFLLIESGPQAWVNRKILSNKILVYIGLISYPLYLWHWPLLSFATIVKSGNVSVSLKLVLIGASFLLAWMTYVFIEKPIRYLKYKSVPLFLCLSMLVVGTLGWVIYLNQGFDFRLSAQESVLKSKLLPTDHAAKLNDIDLYGKSRQCRKLYSQGVSSYVYCNIVGNGSNNVFLIGDSHTDAIYVGYGKTLEKRGYTLVNLAVPGCFVLGSDKKNLNIIHKNCDNDIKNVIDTVLAQKPKIVILSNSYWLENQKTFEEGMDETLSYFPREIKLVWFLQTPRVPFNLMTSISRPLSTQSALAHSSFPRSSYDKMIKGMDIIISRLNNKYPNLITIDPGTVLCNAKNCPVFSDNKFLYGDTTHLSVFGSGYLAENLSIDKYFPDLTRSMVR
jgi:peptidoglycan/LPS O-acetylase OafA/YrhL